MSTEITSPQQLADLVSKDGALLVDFWAAWCGPCRQLSKELIAVKANYGDKLTIVKVNVDEQQELAQQFQVSSIPMMVLYKDGENKGSLVGARPARRLIEELDPFVK